MEKDLIIFGQNFKILTIVRAAGAMTLARLMLQQNLFFYHHGQAFLSTTCIPQFQISNPEF